MKVVVHVQNKSTSKRRSIITHFFEEGKTINLSIASQAKRCKFYYRKLPTFWSPFSREHTNKNTPNNSSHITSFTISPHKQTHIGQKRCELFHTVRCKFKPVFKYKSKLSVRTHRKPKHDTKLTQSNVQDIPVWIRNKKKKLANPSQWKAQKWPTKKTKQITIALAKSGGKPGTRSVVHANNLGKLRIRKRKHTIAKGENKKSCTWTKWYKSKFQKYYKFKFNENIYILKLNSAVLYFFSLFNFGLT